MFGEKCDCLRKIGSVFTSSLIREIPRGEVLRPPAQQSIKHMQAWKLKTRVSVDMLEDEADALVASHFSIGHIALGVALGYIDFRFPELNWRDGHPKLAAWHKTFEARPSVKANEAVDEP